MPHSWYVIDHEGRRNVTRSRMDFWKKFDYSGDDSDWPAFTQLVTTAGLRDLCRAIEKVAETLALSAQDVTDDPTRWEEALLIAENGDALVVTEPGVDREDRFLSDPTADAVAGLLAADGAFFGHDPATGLVHLTTFELGAPELAWFDSTQPGPSFARTFRRDGTATEEDPRKFALRVLDMPETSPLLDRYAFVFAMLKALGIERIEPALDDLKVVRALLLR